MQRGATPLHSPYFLMMRFSRRDHAFLRYGNASNSLWSVRWGESLSLGAPSTLAASFAAVVPENDCPGVEALLAQAASISGPNSSESDPDSGPSP